MARPSLKVAALQLNSQSSVEDNLQRCNVLIDEASARGADLVVLPENFAYFGAAAGRAACAEVLGSGPIQAALGQAAERNGVTLIAGGMPELSADPARPYNTALVIARNGQLVSSYRKMHLFDVTLGDGTELRESAAASAGVSPVIVEVDGFKIGLSICYDLRFPELYRSLSDSGADVFVVPAAFTVHTGKDHWHVLLRARAIEGQAWVVAAAQWGKHPEGRSTYGHSLVVDPWGTVVSECSDGVGMAFAELSHERTQDIRTQLPSLRHRRLL